MSYKYRYTGESARASFPDADGHSWFPSQGDEFVSKTAIDHPFVELVADEDKPQKYTAPAVAAQEDNTAVDEVSQDEA